MGPGATVQDITGILTARLGLKGKRIVAGGGDDNADQAGSAILRTAWNTVGVVCTVGCALGTAETAAVTYRLQDSEDGSTDWMDIGAIESFTVTDAVADEAAAEMVSRTLAGAREYIRAVGKVNLSRAATDTADIAIVLLFGGGQEYPLT
jgi:hypothetical protein